MPNAASKPSGQARAEGKAPYVTSAVGLGEPTGRVRARRSSLFTQTVVWVTVLVSLAFLCGTLVQAWSNHQLAQQLQHEQQITQQLQNAHDSLTKQVGYYQDPYVVEGEARQHLGYARPGEHVVVVVGGNTQNQAQATPISHPTASKNFWQAWWQIFFSSP